MPFGVGTPCKKHGYPCLEPCPIAIEEENEWFRIRVQELERVLTDLRSMDDGLTDGQDFIVRKALNIGWNGKSLGG